MTNLENVTRNSTMKHYSVDMNDSFDEDFASEDEFVRRTDLFVGHNKESFLDCYIPIGNGVGTINAIPEELKSVINHGISDGIAHMRSLSVAELHKLSQIECIKAQTSPLNENSGCQDATETADHVEAFFIRQQNSNSRLLITRELFEGLAKERRIFSRVKEHVMSFGFKVREDDIGPPICRFLSRINNDKQENRYEFVYGLRYVERVETSSPADEWRVRQSAIYQSVKWSEDRPSSETWLFISPSRRMEKMICKYMRHKGRNRLTTNFDLHLSLLRIAISNWRWYIKTLGRRTSEQTSRIVASSVGREPSPLRIDFQINFEDQQNLRVIQDRVLDLVVIWDSTLDTINELLRRWQYLKPQMSHDIIQDHVSDGLQDCVHEVRLCQGKTNVLLKRIQGTATLLSNLLEHENGKQMQYNGRSLKVLAEETRLENASMRRLAEKATKDTAAVKAITLITIIYLPTTVVAGFFSTQFVFQEEKDGRPPRLSMTENWWIYVAISVPLTVFTIAVWYAWIKYPWEARWARPFMPRESNRQDRGARTQNIWDSTTSGETYQGSMMSKDA